MSGYYLILVFYFFGGVHGGTEEENLQKWCVNGRQTLMLDLPEVTPDWTKSTVADNTQELVQNLKLKTGKVQAPILDTLRVSFPEIPVNQILTYWIVNRIALKNVSCDLIPRIICIPYPFVLRHERVMSIYSPDPLSPKGGIEPRGIYQIQWNIERINAPKVWPTTKGAGAVVASISSGARSTHEDIKDNYRGGEYSWLNGFTNSSEGLPIDTPKYGFGTSSLGIVCGISGNGVAPEAKWVSCRGCDDSPTPCFETALLTCAQWTMCPYKTTGGVVTQDCTKRPHIVDNGWAGSPTHDFYNGVIKNWHRAGIIPIFPSSNFGVQGCSTLGSPADQIDVISVGVTDGADRIYEKSGRGPSRVNRRIKPDIVAPGVLVYSIDSAADNAGIFYNGHNLAVSHVSGAVALMVSKKPTVTFEEVLKALQTTSASPGVPPNKFDACSSICTFDPSTCYQGATLPNNLYGYGILNAEAAFNAVS